MKVRCKVLENSHSDVRVLINDKIELLCFSNVGINSHLGDDCLLELDIYDDFEITSSNSSEKYIKYVSGYQYNIIGILDFDRGGIDSLFFIELEDLFGYEYLDNKMVELNVLRFNISEID